MKKEKTVLHNNIQVTIRQQPYGGASMEVVDKAWPDFPVEVYACHGGVLEVNLIDVMHDHTTVLISDKLEV